MKEIMNVGAKENFSNKKFVAKNPIKMTQEAKPREI